MAEQEDNCKRICVWSGPRNVSTALMYAFDARGDTRVLDEPLYGHYLRVSGREHPHPDKVMAAMDCDADRVIRREILGPCDRPILFMKMMAHQLVELDWSFMDQCRNVILTRDPREVLPTLSVQLREPNLTDTGYRVQLALLERFSTESGPPPVLDARELLLDPPGVLRALCERLDIAYTPRMLSWEAGPKPFDGVWAPYWYHNVHKSTGFMPYRPKTEPFPVRLEPLLEECMPYYERLQEHVLRARESA